MCIQNNENLQEDKQDELQTQTLQNKTPEILLPQYEPKPLFDLAKSDSTFAICGVIASIFLSIFGIFGGFALGYLLAIALMFLLFTVYFTRGGKTQAFPVICGLLSLGSGAVFICTTNSSVRFFGVIISALLLLVYFDGFINGTAKTNRQMLGIFYSSASTVMNVEVAVKSLFCNGNGGKKSMGKVLVGLICAIPVLLVVVPLLIASDDAFRGMMSDIFSNTFSTILKAIFGLGISLFVISYGFSLKKGRASKINYGNFAGIENVYVISFLSAIGACYLLYLFSQLAYFFSAFKGFLPNGQITYAQYARKGFFEMCVIAVINLIIVLCALIFSKKQSGKVCHGIKALATFIALFTLIIIATAISKMVLYIGAYGMTVLRITTSSFMVFLGIVFISLILRIYITKINIIKTALISAGCIVLLLGSANVNAVCARYNYESYCSSKLNSIDVEQLYYLGYEGIPYIVELVDCEEAEIAKQARGYLAKAYLYDYFDDIRYADGFTVEDLKQNEKHNSFDRFSIPKAKAYKKLYKFIEDNPDFSNLCEIYFEALNLKKFQ